MPLTPSPPVLGLLSAVALAQGQCHNALNTSASTATTATTTTNHAAERTMRVHCSDQVRREQLVLSQQFSANTSGMEIADRSGRRSRFRRRWGIAPH